MSASASKNLAGDLAPAAAIAWSWICAISNGGDMDAANEMLHDELVYWTNLDRRWASKASVVKLGAWRAKFVPITFTLTRAISEGDVAVLELDGAGETARGERYDNCYAMVFTVRDGKIVELREHGDSALMLEVFPGATDAWRAAKDEREAARRAAL